MEFEHNTQIWYIFFKFILDIILNYHLKSSQDFYPTVKASDFTDIIMNLVSKDISR